MKPVPLALALLLIFASVLTFAPNAAAVLQVVTEDFEDDPLGAANPTGFYSAMVESGAGTKDIVAGGASGTSQAYRIAGGTEHETAMFTLGTDLCGPDFTSFSFQWKFSSYATNHGAWLTWGRSVAYEMNAGDQYFGVTLDTANDWWRMTGRTSAVSSSNGPVLISSASNAGLANTWVTVELSNLDCGAGSFYMCIAGNCGTYDQAGSFSSIDKFILTTSRPGVVGPTMYVDQIALDSMNQAVVADASVATAGLQDFRVDGNGANIITRQSTPTNAVVAYNAQTLAETGRDATNFCNIESGIAAYTEALFYTICENNAAQPDGIRLRNPDMGTLTRPAGCFDNCPGTYYESNPDWFDQLDIPADIHELHTMDYYVFESGQNKVYNDHATSAFPYTSTSGYVGATAITYNTGQDNAYDDRKLYAATPPDDSCFWRTQSTGQDFLVVVDEASPTKMYEQIVDVVGTINRGPLVQTNLIYTNSALLQNANSVDCAGDIMAIRGADGTLRVASAMTAGGLSRGDVLHTIATGDTTRNGVALSSDGKYVAYKAGTAARVVRVSDGVEVADVALPTGVGSFVGLDLGLSGSQLWVGHNSELTLYDVQTYTCDTGCTTDPVDGAGGGGGSSPGAVQGEWTGISSNTGTSTVGSYVDPGPKNLPGVDLQRFADDTGISLSGAGWILALMLTIALTGALASVAGPLAGVGGFVLGIGIGTAFGLYPLWFVVLLFMICAAVTVLLLKGRG